MSETVRQQLATHLRAGPATLRDLARALGLNERQTADHLRHVLRSLGPGERLREEPARCGSCGFVFRKRERLTAPGRCPLCRGERIHPAHFWIEGEGP